MAGRVPLPVTPNQENLRYLIAKRDRLGHEIDGLPGANATPGASATPGTGDVPAGNAAPAGGAAAGSAAAGDGIAEAG